MSTIIKEVDVSGLTYSMPTDLEYNTGYSVILTAVNSSGSSSEYSESFNIVDAPTPQTPTITLPADGATGIALNGTITYSGSEPTYEWQITSDAAFTNIIDSGSTSLAASMAMNETLYDFSTTYYFRVRASHSYNGGTYTKYSDWVSVSFTTVAMPSLNLSASSSANSVTVSWDTATKYVSTNSIVVNCILHSSNANVGHVDTVSLSTGSETFTSLWWETEYELDVGVTFVNGQTNTETVYSTTANAAVPDAPTSLVPASGSTGVSESPAFSWTSPESSFDIEVSANSDYSSPIQSSSPATAAYQYSGNLDWSTEYFWRVRAKRSYNSGSLIKYSAWVNANLTIKPIPVPAAETGVTITFPTALRPKFDWAAIQYADHYHIKITKP